MRFSAFVFILFLGACSALRQADLLLTSQQTNLQPVDGDINLNAFYFDTTDNPQDMVLFITGSGCASIHSYLPGYLKSLTGSFRIFSVEKQGVEMGDLGFSCGTEYLANNTFERRTAQNEKLLKRLIEYTSEFKKVFIIGVSEGGSIAAALTAKFDPKIDATLIIGAGGLPQRRSLEILNKKYDTRYDLDHLDKKIADDPDSLELIYGQTVKYWKSFLNVSVNELVANTKTPMLFVMGMEDKSEPIESLFALEHKGFPNIETLAIEGANHVLISAHQDNKPELFSYFFGKFTGSEQ